MTVSSQGQGGQGSSEGVNSLVTYNPSLFELTDEGNLMGPPASIGKQSRESTPQSGDGHSSYLCTRGEYWANIHPCCKYSPLLCTLTYSSYNSSIPLCRFSLWHWAERMVKAFLAALQFAFPFAFTLDIHVKFIYVPFLLISLRFSLWHWAKHPPNQRGPDGPIDQALWQKVITELQLNWSMSKLQQTSSFTVLKRWKYLIKPRWIRL